MPPRIPSIFVRVTVATGMLDESRMSPLMNRLVRLSCAALVVCVACSSSSKKKSMTTQEMISADPLPLAKGAKWEYQVTVKRFDPEANKETTKSLTWTTEVIDAREAN